MTNAPEPFDCPSCGAPLDMRLMRNNLILCPYCGKTSILPERLDQVKQRQAGKPIKRRENLPPLPDPEPIPGEADKNRRRIFSSVIVFLLLILALVLACMFLSTLGNSA